MSRSKFFPSPSQSALLDVLAEVPYLRLEAGGTHDIFDAVSLEREGMVRLAHKVYGAAPCGMTIVACVAKTLVKPAAPALPVPAMDGPKPGDRVSVIRHRHGWEDGRVTAVIQECHGKGFVAIDEETGAELEIEHARDVRPF
jgi:hypothetical protein